MITDLAISRGLYHAPAFFADENELRELWSRPDTRDHLLQHLAEKGPYKPSTGKYNYVVLSIAEDQGDDC